MNNCPSFGICMELLKITARATQVLNSPHVGKYLLQLRYSSRNQSIMIFSAGQKKKGLSLEDCEALIVPKPSVEK